MQALRILTWHVHGSYLYNLVQGGHEWYVPMKPSRPEGYGGRSGHFDWPENVHEVPAGDVRRLQLDCVITQSRKNYLEDRDEVLGPDQRRLPQLHIEHDPPREHPTDTRHFVDDPNVLLVHVTEFNRLMWDAGSTPTRVIEHGVVVPAEYRYTGEIARGLVCVNNIFQRGRRTGADVFERARAEVTLALVGMGSDAVQGLGDLPRHRLFEAMTAYRFFFNPIRYTSLGLSVCEAMTVGMPIVALATTEMPTVIENGVSGYVDISVDRLIDRMRDLIASPALAAELGRNARGVALDRFGIDRFIRDWDNVLEEATGLRLAVPHAASERQRGREDRYEQTHRDDQRARISHERFGWDR